MKDLIKQILKFGVVGIICTIIDFGVMILLKEAFHVNYLAASITGFVVSVVVNYILSMKFVFHGKKDANRVREFVIFVILSVVGLGINSGIMYLTVDKWNWNYIFSKVAATAIVMVFNFITRKMLLEERKA